MPQEGYNSSSSSEARKKFGLSPYMLETDRTPTEVENLLKELELKQNSPQDDCPQRNTRIGNIDWCFCSKTCVAMMTETEILCCIEGNDKGIISLCADAKLLLTQEVYLGPLQHFKWLHL